MGICLAYTTVRDETIDKIVENPKLVLRVLEAEDPIEHISTRAGALRAFFGRKRRPPEVLGLAEDEGIEGDLDKAWQAIHWLLNGTTDCVEGPLGLLNYGGTTIDQVELGMGPPWFLRSGELRASHDAIDAISDEELESRFDEEAMRAQFVRAPDLWYAMHYMEIFREDLANSVERDLGWILHYC